MMTKDEYARIMGNWARWYVTGGAGDCAISGVYSGMVNDSREMREPVLNGEAEDMFEVISRLADDLREVVYARWLRLAPDGGRLGSAPDNQVARRLRCSEPTFYRRLEQARQAICNEWDERRRVARRVAGLAS